PTPARRRPRTSLTLLLLRRSLHRTASSSLSIGTNPPLCRRILLWTLFFESAQCVRTAASADRPYPGTIQVQLSCQQRTRVGSDGRFDGGGGRGATDRERTTGCRCT